VRTESGNLILVPTPIGNMEDITYRAVRLLTEADLILAEDTRKTGQLLKKLNVRGKLQSYHTFNEQKTVNQIITKLEQGMNIALVSDAGTPGISDPGYLIVKTCIGNGITVECLPGPTALIPALVVSGLPCEKFVFEGFLPHKKGRIKRLEMIKEEKRTVIFYESPHRILKTLNQLKEYCGTDRRISVSREISKIFEETIRGSIAEVISHFSDNPPRGELVIVLEGAAGK